MAVLRRPKSDLLPPLPSVDHDLFKRGAVKGLRLPPSQQLVQEDDRCPTAPYGKCVEGEIGRMVWTPDGECSCHLHPPCSSCENSYLMCSACGFEYRGTAEDNVEVQSYFRRNAALNKPAPVDFEPFDLYAIYGSTKRGLK